MPHIKHKCCTESPISINKAKFCISCLIFPRISLYQHLTRVSKTESYPSLLIEPRHQSFFKKLRISLNMPPPSSTSNQLPNHVSSCFEMWLSSVPPLPHSSCSTSLLPKSSRPRLFSILCH